MHPKIEMVSLLELFGLAPLPKLLLGLEPELYQTNP
jgi:hypothetical protein